MKNDEISVLKSQMLKINDSTAVLVSMQYHTETKDVVGGSKVDRSKSLYRWFAHVYDITDLKAKIAGLLDPSVSQNRFKFENDPLDFYIATTDSTNERIASWLAMKLKKLRDWDSGIKLLDGWENSKQSYNQKAKYETEDYICADGTTKISLKDKDALLKHVGENLVKNVPSRA